MTLSVQQAHTSVPKFVFVNLQRSKQQTKLPVRRGSEQTLPLKEEDLIAVRRGSQQTLPIKGEELSAVRLGSRQTQAFYRSRSKTYFSSPVPVMCWLASRHCSFLWAYFPFFPDSGVAIATCFLSPPRVSWSSNTAAGLSHLVFQVFTVNGVLGFLLLLLFVGLFFYFFF